MIMTRLTKAAAFASALFLAAGIASTPQALAQTSQICTAKWENAPATSHCTKHQMIWLEPDPGQSNGCQLIAVCNVDVKIGETDRTFARNFYALGTANDMGTLALCFRRSSDPLAIDGWVLFFQYGCRSGDVDVDTAVEDGLSG